MGKLFLPRATVISHAHCRTLLEERGGTLARDGKETEPCFTPGKIVLPHMTFVDGDLTLRVGKKNLIISPCFGHSDDGISVLVEEDRILFAGDSFMPVPHVVDGDVDANIASIKHISKLGLENIVQGHGDIILRGEIDAAVKENLNYLNSIKKAVKAISKRKNAAELLEEIKIEDCGKSRVKFGVRETCTGAIYALLYKMTE